MQAVRLLLS